MTASQQRQFGDRRPHPAAERRLDEIVAGVDGQDDGVGLQCQADVLDAIIVVAWSRRRDAEIDCFR
ncbi:MAG TPA: hypothetical protein VKA75_17590, partial [Reyranella sp.]|nr:hypothetical protein [Reyranella sp.]